MRDHLKGCKGDKIKLGAVKKDMEPIDVEQPRMLEAAVSHPVEGTLSTEGAPHPAAHENPHHPPPAAVQEYHIPGAQQQPAQENPDDVC